MCLFSNDQNMLCNHVECNLIRTIQLQNPLIFPHLVHNQQKYLNSKNNNHQQEQLQQQNQSSPIDQQPQIPLNHHHNSNVQQIYNNNNSPILQIFNNPPPITNQQRQQIDKKIIKQQQHKQQQSQLNIINQNTSYIQQQINIKQSQHQMNEKQQQQQHYFYEKQQQHFNRVDQSNNKTNKISRQLLNSSRITVLETQVNMLQYAMKNLIDNLKLKNILTPQQCQTQYHLLQQILNLSTTIPQHQHNQQHHHNKK